MRTSAGSFRPNPSANAGFAQAAEDEPEGQEDGAHRQRRRDVGPRLRRGCRPRDHRPEERDRARTAEQRVKGKNRRFCKKKTGEGSRAPSLIFWKIEGAGGGGGKLVWLFSFLTGGIILPIARKRTLAAHRQPSCPGPQPLTKPLRSSDMSNSLILEARLFHSNYDCSTANLKPV